jgi:hypothetical protein
MNFKFSNLSLNKLSFSKLNGVIVSVELEELEELSHESETFLFNSSKLGEVNTLFSSSGKYVSIGVLDELATFSS